MAKQFVSLLITDLDNTVWDWVEIWFQSFSALLTEVVRTSGVDQATLEAEIKVVHQHRETSEYALLLQELPSLQARHDVSRIPEIYAEALHAHRSARKAATRLYDGVRETLDTVAASGALIVGYTESMAYYTSDRIRRTKLDDVLDFVYSAPDHDFPAGLTPEQLRKYPEEYYRFRRTEHRHTPRGALKPNPSILSGIVDDLCVKKDEAIYLGDSLMKDVIMAQQIGVTDVWAEYGVAHTRHEGYELLRRVTHWKPSAVQQERELKPEDVKPTHVLSAFSDLLELFSFGRSARPATARSHTSPER